MIFLLEVLKAVLYGVVIFFIVFGIATMKSKK